jgi:hypothetical protein
MVLMLLLLKNNALGASAHGSQKKNVSFAQLILLLGFLLFFIFDMWVAVLHIYE